VTDLHELFVYELDASETRSFEQFDLWLDEQIKRNLGNEETRPRTGRVSNGGSDVLRRQVVSRVNRFQRLAKDIVEDVIDTGAAAQLFGRDLERCAFDRGHKIAGELGHEFQDQ
jgi:hypothetical protein